MLFCRCRGGGHIKRISRYCGDYMRARGPLITRKCSPMSCLFFIPVSSLLCTASTHFIWHLGIGPHSSLPKYQWPARDSKPLRNFRFLCQNLALQPVPFSLPHPHERQRLVIQPSCARVRARGRWRWCGR